MTDLISNSPSVSSAKIKVLIIDDSAVVRAQLCRRLIADSRIDVITPLANWDSAIAATAGHQPDVVVLDIELPSLRGPGLIREMIENMKPAVIALASPTSTGAAAAVEALAAGAMDCVVKPASSAVLDDFGAELVRKIHAADKTVWGRRTIDGINVCTGTAGGVKPLVSMLAALPIDAPPTFVVLQLPAGITKALVRYLSNRCVVAVKEAENGDAIRPGRVLIAPGGKHCLVRRSGSELRVQIKDGPQLHHERPSRELFTRSILK